MNVKPLILTKRLIVLMTLALTVCAALVSANSANAAVPVLPQNTPFKLKFAHSGQVLNVPNASKAEDQPLIQWHDWSGFKNDDFEFIKVNSPAFGPNSYVIEAGKNAFGLQLYVIPREGKSGSPVVQDRHIGPYSVWDLVQSPQKSDHVQIVHRNSKLAMNVYGAFTAAGTGVIVYPPSSVHLNDDIKISPAT